MKLFIDVSFKIFNDKLYYDFTKLSLKAKNKMFIDILNKSIYDKTIIENISFDSDIENFNFMKHEEIEEIKSENIRYNQTISDVNLCSLSPLNMYYFLNPCIYLSQYNYNSLPENSFFKKYYYGDLINQINDVFIQDETIEYQMLNNIYTEMLFNDLIQLYETLKSNNNLNENIIFINNLLQKYTPSNNRVLMCKII